MHLTPRFVVVRSDSVLLRSSMHRIRVDGGEARQRLDGRFRRYHKFYETTVIRSALAPAKFISGNGDVLRHHWRPLGRPLHARHLLPVGQLKGSYAAYY